MRNTTEIQQELIEAQKNVEETQKILLQQQLRVKILKNELECNKNIKTPRVNQLSNEEISRYSRQLIVPGFGVKGQERLKDAAVLIVGMGGLGCPAAQYLAAAGIGKLGLVDYDTVDSSNFHRQILHAEGSEGMTKVQSARQYLESHSHNCQISTYNLLLNKDNALSIIAAYDVVLDCTDNMPTRYLLNDACVLTKKPLISGSALQTDGQLTVYNLNDASPCYRCLFPKPAPPETVTNCSDAGVLGAITGVIGSLQALEAVKIISGLGEVLAGRMLIFDGARLSFRCIKLRGRRLDCDVCSKQANIKQLIDYEQFCGQLACDKVITRKLLSPQERLTVNEAANVIFKEQLNEYTFIDVRSPAEFEICHLPKSLNMPLDALRKDKHTAEIKDLIEKGKIVCVCRRGNDSQLAVMLLREKLENNSITDLLGGLYAWHYEIDNSFPIY